MAKQLSIGNHIGIIIVIVGKYWIVNAVKMAIDMKCSEYNCKNEAIKKFNEEYDLWVCYEHRNFSFSIYMQHLRLLIEKERNKINSDAS